MAFAAVQQGDLEELKRLIEVEEISVNKNRGYGYSLLSAAVGCEQFEITKYLIENGAEIDNLNMQGANAFLLACQLNKDTKIVRYLVNQNCKIHVTVIHGI